MAQTAIPLEMYVIETLHATMNDKKPEVVIAKQQCVNKVYAAFVDVDCRVFKNAIAFHSLHSSTSLLSVKNTEIRNRYALSFAGYVSQERLSASS